MRFRQFGTATIPEKQRTHGRCGQAVPGALLECAHAELPDRAPLMDYLLVLVFGLLGGTLGGIVGTGSSIVLMPILVLSWGRKRKGAIAGLRDVRACGGPSPPEAATLPGECG